MVSWIVAVVIVYCGDYGVTEPNQSEKELYIITKVHSNYNLLCLRNRGMVSAGPQGKGFYNKQN